MPHIPDRWSSSSKLICDDDLIPNAISVRPDTPHEYFCGVHEIHAGERHNATITSSWTLPMTCLVQRLSREVMLR